MEAANRVPHFATTVGFCVAAILGYSAFSIWAVWWSQDNTLQGDVIGTWKSFAVAAFAFWLGSSSGGKAQPTSPAPVTVENPPERPVPVDVPEPTFGKDGA